LGSAACIELSDDADHRFARSPRGGERRRNLGHSRDHREAGSFQLGLQERAALLFLVADFGKGPDLHGDVAIRRRFLIDRREHRVGVHRLPKYRTRRN
jgi:hypothetical protein